MSTNESLHLRFIKIIDDILPPAMFSESYRAETLNRFLEEAAVKDAPKQTPQDEQDRASYMAWIDRRPCLDLVVTNLEIWLAAKRDERKWFRGELEKITAAGWTWSQSNAEEILRSMRDRCREGAP